MDNRAAFRVVAWRLGRLSSFAVALLLGTQLIVHPVLAGDWPQILGPDRNGVAAADETFAVWSQSGPRELWQRSVGDGLAGVAVAAGRALVFHRRQDYEVIEALDAATGDPIWEADYPTSYRSGISPDSGPRCVPLIDGDRVITYGAEGRLSCWSLATGKELWSVDTRGAFQPPSGYFGAGSTPIVIEDNVIVNVGARNAGIVAFDRLTGRVRWKVTSDQASYSAPSVTGAFGRPWLLIVTRLNFRVIDAAEGTVIFTSDFGKRGPTVNGATPIVVEGHAFLSSSYGIGSALIKLDRDASRIVAKKNNLLATQYATPVPFERTLFAVDGRDDMGVCSLKAFDPLEAKLHWEKNNFGYASVTRAADKLLLLTTRGEMVLAKAHSRAYDELARWSLFATTTRALPAISNGRLYARDTKTLKCVQLGPE